MRCKSTNKSKIWRIIQERDKQAIYLLNWKNWTSSTHIAHRDFTAHCCLLLSGHIGIPVANQTVILHTVVLMANQPVCVHFAFSLVGEGNTWGIVTLTKPSGWSSVKCDEKNLGNRLFSPKFPKISIELWLSHLDSLYTQMFQRYLSENLFVNFNLWK